MEPNLADAAQPVRAAVGRGARGLQHVSVLQGTKAYGAHVGAVVSPAASEQPRHDHANFYWLQEDYLRERRAAAAWSLTILRPQVVFGEALGSQHERHPGARRVRRAGRLPVGPLDFPGGARRWCARPSTPICWRGPCTGRRPRRGRRRDVQHHQRRRVHHARRVAGHRRRVRHGGRSRRAGVAGGHACRRARPSGRAIVERFGLPAPATFDRLRRAGRSSTPTPVRSGHQRHRRRW